MLRNEFEVAFRVKGLCFVTWPFLYTSGIFRSTHTCKRTSCYAATSSMNLMIQRCAVPLHVFIKALTEPPPQLQMGNNIAGRNSAIFPSPNARRRQVPSATHEHKEPRRRIAQRPQQTAEMFSARVLHAKAYLQVLNVANNL